MTQRRYALIGSSIGKVDQTVNPADGDLLLYDLTAGKWTYASGTGSGIDADTVDGYEGAALAVLAEDETVTGNWTFSGTLSIPEAAVTAHVAAIDHDSLLNFVAAEHIDWSATGAEDVHADRIAEGAVTQHVGAIDHDSLLNFVANEHIDWTAASANFSTTGTFVGGPTGAIITASGTEIDLTATTLDINAASDFSGQAVFNAASTGGSGSIKLAASSNPGIYWDDGAAAADTGNWLLYSSAGTMRWRIYNDAGSVNTEFLTVQRSTTTVSQITLAATELQFDGTTLDINAATYMPAGTTSVAPLNIPHGSAPTAPVNGDIWTTTAGLYVRINGSTIGPLS